MYVKPVDVNYSNTLLTEDQNILTELITAELQATCLKVTFNKFH